MQSAGIWIRATVANKAPIVLLFPLRLRLFYWDNGTITETIQGCPTAELIPMALVTSAIAKILARFPNLFQH